MLKKILVIVRGADPEQPAVLRAALCAGPNTEISLLDVVHEPALDGFTGNAAIHERLRERVVAERRERVEALVTRLKDRGLDVGGSAVWGRPLDEVVAKRVRFAGPDLVVMAVVEEEGGGLSASEWRVITTCPAPLLVVKRAPERKYERVVAAVDPFHEAVKPEKLNLAILAEAQKLRGHARLDVVHCRAPIERFGADLTTLPGYMPAGQAEKRVLEELVQKAGVAASTVQVVSGSPHEVLTRMSVAGETDLIVMGALTRARLTDWLVGSTAERVLHAARADVLAVKLQRRR